MLFIVVKINSVAIYLSQTPRVSVPYIVPRTVGIGVLKVRVWGGVGQRSDLPLDKFLVPLLSSLKGGVASVRGHAHDPKFPSCCLWFLLCPTPNPSPWGQLPWRGKLVESLQLTLGSKEELITSIVRSQRSVCVLRKCCFLKGSTGNTWGH